MSLSAQIDSLRRELQGNQRLRLGIWLILLIFGYYLCMVLADYQQGLTEEYQDITEKSVRLAALLEQAEWPERARGAKAALVQLEAKLPTADSPGLAQANVRTWLDRELKKLRISSTRVRVDTAAQIPGASGVLRVGATVEGTYRQDTFARLLLAIEAGPMLMSVEQLDIKLAKSQRFSLVFNSYFQGAAK